MNNIAPPKRILRSFGNRLPQVFEKIHKINKFEIVINWEQIIDNQYKCLKKGVNGISIPDLIIAQNTKQNHSSIYSLDDHFNRMENILDIKLIDHQPSE